MRRSGFNRHHRQRGSVVLVALAFTTVLGIATVGFITACYRSMQLSNRAFNGARSVQFAEMGMEEALWSLKNGDWSAWTIAGSTATRTITGFTYPDGCTGEIHLRVQNYATNSSSLTVEGQTTLSDGTTVKKQLVATASQAPVFTNAIYSKSTTGLGAGGTVDSYDSSSGPYSTATAGYSAIVAGSSTGSPPSAAVVVNDGNIRGYVAYAGPTPTFGSFGSLRGPDTPTQLRIDPSRYLTSPWQIFPDIKPVTGGSILPSGSVTIGTAGATSPSIYYTSALNLSLGRTIVVDGPVVLDITGQFTVDTSGAGIVVTSNGSLELHFGGDLSLAGRGIENQTLDPKKVALLGTSTSTDPTSHIFSSESPFHGVLYLPNAPMYFYNAVQFHGAVVAQAVAFHLSSNPQVHYDTALRNPIATFRGLTPSYQLTNWREITDPAEMTQF